MPQEKDGSQAAVGASLEHPEADLERPGRLMQACQSKRETGWGTPNAVALTCQDGPLLAPTPLNPPSPRAVGAGNAVPQPLREGGSKLLVGDTPTSPAGGGQPPEPPLCSFLCNATGGTPRCPHRVAASLEQKSWSGPDHCPKKRKRSETRISFESLPHLHQTSNDDLAKPHLTKFRAYVILCLAIEPS